MAHIHFETRLPEYFYRLDHPARWSDPFATGGEERLVLTPHEVIQKGRRRVAYRQWCEAFDLPANDPLFQAIRVVNWRHDEMATSDWFRQYEGALFRVWVKPITNIVGGKGDWIQFYVVCPEDCELMHRYEWSKRGRVFPPRSALVDPWISRFKELRKARIIPTTCCKHFRHERRESDGLL